MNYDYQTSKDVAIRNAVVSGVSLLGATTALYMLFSTPNTSKGLKWLYASTAVTSSISGLLATRNTEGMLDITQTYKDVSRVVRATTLYQQMSSPKDVAHQEVFNWQDFKTKPDEYPHALLLGASGDGKSTLAENLAGLMSPAMVVAVVPHWQAGDFEAADRVVAKERNVGDGFDGDPSVTPPLYNWADIEQLPVSTSVSACELLHALYWEMHRRYQIDSLGRFLGASERELVVILDEFLLYAKLPGIGLLWKKLVREARKVRIRLIILVQGDGVASLGIEGEGDLRESLTYIYLKNFAIEHLERCYNKATVTTKPYYHWVREQFKVHRPCMVEDKLAILPQPEEYVQRFRTIRGAEQGIWSRICDASPRTAIDTQAEERGQAGQASRPADSFLEGYDEVVESLSPEQLDRTLKTLWDAAKDAASQDMPSGTPMTQEAIIKKVWGYEASQYKTGKVLWALATAKFGRINLRT